jgi:methyl-accepting chemotaxis protein
MLKFFRHLSLNAKIFLLGTGSVLITAAFLVVLALWQSAQYNRLAQKEVDALIDSDLDHTTQGVYNLVRTEGEAVQDQVNQSLQVARQVLTEAGEISQLRDSVTWNVINEFSNVPTAIRLPKILVNDRMLGQTTRPRDLSQVVDKVAALTGVDCTIFQRMNEAGSMLRVSGHKSCGYR